VLVGGAEVYAATGSYIQPWTPSISNYPSTVVCGQTHAIFGRQFNDLSQAAAFGDEFETATNY
jgi:hypothetical protein